MLALIFVERWSPVVFLAFGINLALAFTLALAADTLAFAAGLDFVFALTFGETITLLILGFARVEAFFDFFEAVFNTLATDFFFGADFFIGFEAFTGLASIKFFALDRLDETVLSPDLEIDFDFAATVVTLALIFVFVLVFLESDSLI